MAERCYLITGASGLIGRELLWTIAGREPEARIFALLRAPAGEAEARAASLGLRALAPRLAALPGDLMRLRAGLSARDVERLSSEVTHVVHLGAQVRFDQELAAARQVNVFGTRQVLDLAARMRRLERVVHVSTAFVAGDRGGALLEGPAEPGRPRNTYERTKLEAEELVRRAMVALPITLVRPSIVGPGLHRAAEAHFLLLLRLYLERGWRWVPGARGSIVDLIPVEVVARAMHALALRPMADSRWYHLAAGPRATTLGRLGAIASRAFGVPPLRFAPPGLVRAALRLAVWGATRRSLDRATPFVPYLRVRTRVDTTDSHRVLRELGIEIPATEDYFRALLHRMRTEAPHATIPGPAAHAAIPGPVPPPVAASSPASAAPAPGVAAPAPVAPAATPVSLAQTATLAQTPARASVTARPARLRA